ncbi:hypothetical protein PPACK8108_LOCUS1392 [Phakopsora pachyrhizi]|uniref:Uncharacterized protein n=1 Tax=Phakopsora pachyrhizi TaxID=170000 RepID=A0AAV0AIT5_PHAPC|nr:hypothetical protein PPACK8108_LOCUS1392 [Phakopsora pachyrhizi]
MSPISNKSVVPGIDQTSLIRLKLKPYHQEPDVGGLEREIKKLGFSLDRREATCLHLNEAEEDCSEKVAVKLFGDGQNLDAVNRRGEQTLDELNKLLRVEKAMAIVKRAGEIVQLRKVVGGESQEIYALGIGGWSLEVIRGSKSYQRSMGMTDGAVGGRRTEMCSVSWLAGSEACGTGMKPSSGQIKI